MCCISAGTFQSKEGKIVVHFAKAKQQTDSLPAQYCTYSMVTMLHAAMHACSIVAMMHSIRKRKEVFAIRVIPGAFVRKGGPGLLLSKQQSAEN